jgi:uncharacterized protein YifE (UPF0438 family)
MIRVSNNFAKAMEFTSFKKKESVTDDELINAVMKFENVLLNQSGVIFHCLVRNFKNEYANVLFVENVEHLHSLSKEIVSFKEAKDFFSLIEMDSVKMTFHTILKDNFAIPEGFACIEHGTFNLKDEATVEQFKMASDELEKYYLKTNDNYLEHFIGNIKDKKVSELAIGKTFAKTKQICYGYLENKYGQAFLNLANAETFDLDFWYLIA